MSPPLGAVTPDTAIEDDRDARVVLAELPPTHTVKGMFLAKLVDELGPDWARAAGELVAPPKWGRYLPFSDYPMVDQAHLAFASARRRFPRLSLVEAVRRLARDDMSVLLQSTFGRITVAVLDGPRSALLAIPTVYKHVVRGCRYEAEAIADRHVRLSLVDLRGSWGYQVGQLEGIVHHWGVRSTIRCSEPDERTRRFDVSW